MEENRDDIIDMINKVSDEEYAKASNIFNSLIGDKISDRLDQEKIAVANSIFNNGDDDESDDLEEYEFDDEDLELEDDEDESDDLEEYEFDDDDEI